MDNTALANIIVIIKDIANKIVELLASFEEWKAYFFGDEEDSAVSE